MNNILYISLTGMTEPLGRSQVLEYLIDLSKNNRIHLLSFERENDLDAIKEIQNITQKYNINWQYKVYSNKFGVFSTVAQLFKAFFVGSKIIKEHSINIIHARSMIPATIGWILKKRHGIKLLFDIRGFAIDEKIDSGRLKKDLILYKILKKLDNKLYRVSDHIVTLTHKAKEILTENLGVQSDKITVIPTCANKQIFKLLNAKEKASFRKNLGYSDNDKIIVHTGTVSGWYNFDSELLLVSELMKRDNNIKLLIINKNEHKFIKDIIFNHESLIPNVKLLSSSFNEVYKYLNIAAASIFFIKPTYSKQASAPTKFAENVACKLPSITNGDIGDMGYYLKKHKVGLDIDLNKLEKNINSVSENILNFISKQSTNNEDYNLLFDECFDKNIAVKKYNKIYKSLIDKP